MSLVKWILVLGLVSSCASEQITRARIEADEDRFCSGIAKIRTLEKQTSTLPADAGVE